MIRFPPPAQILLSPALVELRGRGLMTVRAPIRIRLDLGGGLAPMLTIPTGFRSDGVSRPWWLAWMIDPWGRAALAALLHDYLLSLPEVTKWQADLAFLAALRSQGVPAFMSTLLYFAVRTRRPRAPRSS